MEATQADQKQTVSRLEEIEASLACIEDCLRGDAPDATRCAQAVRNVRRGLVDLVASIDSQN